MRTRVDPEQILPVNKLPRDNLEERLNDDIYILANVAHQKALKDADKDLKDAEGSKDDKSGGKAKDKNASSKDGIMKKTSEASSSNSSSDTRTGPRIAMDIGRQQTLLVNPPKLSQFRQDFARERDNSSSAANAALEHSL